MSLVRLGQGMAPVSLKNNVSLFPEGMEAFHSTDGSNRTIDITGANYAPIDEGFMWVELDVDARSGGERYPMTINSGSSANTFAIFLDNGIDFGGYIYRGQSGSILKGNLSISGLLRPPYGTRQVIGISYSNALGTAYIYQNGYVRTQVLSGDITSLSDLIIGSYDGTIYQFAVGNRYLTPEQMRASMALYTTIHDIRGAGQSLKQRWINSDETATDIGYESYIDQLDALSFDVFSYANSAVSGSALMKAHNGTEYWWDEDSNIAGPMLTNMYAEIDSTGVPPKIVSWSQGESDALLLGTSTYPTGLDYKSALKALFDDVRSRYGNVQFFLNVIGRRLSGNNNAGGTQAVRTAQLELILEHDYIHFGAEQYHVTLFDHLHPDDVGLTVIAENEAKAVASYLGEPVSNPTGPQVLNVSLAGDTFTITTDAMSLTGSEGFTYIGSDDVEIAVSGYSISGGEITVTLASTPIDGNGTLYYIYDTGAGLTVSNLFIDGDGMPLRSFLYRSQELINGS